MSKYLASFLLFAAMASAQSGLLPPRVGFLQDEGGSLRQVIGVRATFVLGEAFLDEVHSLAFSGRWGLAAAGEEILVFDAQGHIVNRQKAPVGKVLFAFDHAGQPALACFPETSELYLWSRGEFKPLPWGLLHVDGQVKAIAQSSRNIISLVVECDGVLWINNVSLARGHMRFGAILPGVTAPVLLLPDGSLIYGNGNDVVIRERDTSEKRLSGASPATAFELMGQDWIRIVSQPGSSGLALHLGKEGEQLYRLPGGGQ